MAVEQVPNFVQFSMMLLLQILQQIFRNKRWVLPKSITLHRVDYGVAKFLEIRTKVATSASAFLFNNVPGQMLRIKI